MKTRLFKTAHAIKALFSSFSEALKYAWKVIRLSMEMKKGNVSFSFTKIDGSIRKAIGTLNNVPATLGTKAANYSLFTYFDVESNGWRSSKIENLIF